MDYDVLIIGAGLSGMAAGIRLAHFGKRVCIVERQRLPGGLNSYFRSQGRLVDVGLHAVTNLAHPADKHAPLNRLLRQLRLKREDFDLCPQTHSASELASVRLPFTNDIADLVQAIATAFPAEVDGFRRLIETVRNRDSFALEAQPESTRRVLPEFIRDPALQDLLYLPLMYYGNPNERDMEFNQFCILFQSIFLEGFCRPRAGMKHVIDVLLQRYRECDGELRLACGVRGIAHDGERLTAVDLDDGSRVTASAVLSCAGHPETLALCQPSLPATDPIALGQLAYVETMLFLDRPPRDLGLRDCVLFACESPVFHYERPAVPVDFRSAVICCPGNYIGCEGGYADRQVRLTHLADYGAWLDLPPADYAAAKAAVVERQLALLERRAPGLTAAVQDWDLFTPRTIRRFTGHFNGAIYGSPEKRRDGTTPLRNLFLCGTDQGFLGIIGAMLSGISMANTHLLP
jgi:phytoene dehydrogenase-like protein